MRDGEADKTKCYSALCYCYSKFDSNDIEKLNNLNEVQIFQKTPIRVLHRLEYFSSTKFSDFKIFKKFYKLKKGVQL